MHDHRPLLRDRAVRQLEQWILPAATRPVAPLTVTAYAVTGDDGTPGAGEPISFPQARSQTYDPFPLPRRWGPAWGTTWFHLTGQVPAEAAGASIELLIDLGFGVFDTGFECEALVYRPDGSVVKALNPDNAWLPAEPDADGRIDLYVEAASNPKVLDYPEFYPNPIGDRATASKDPAYEFRRADIVVVNTQARALGQDLSCLLGVADTLPADSHRRRQIEIAVDRALDELDVQDVPATAPAARAVLAPVLDTPAAPGGHIVHAVGHAHIDSAWLWPLRESRRKVARTIANVLALVESGEPLIFALPAAQHAAWLQADQPELFARLRHAVQAGTVIPVGGMWVEPDAVLPGGESLARQFVLGTRWFAENLGVRCRGMWLPDSFGYSAALPQLARQAGMEWFLTQKLSWNQVNVFPHHTLWWEGIDGSRIFTHFPPMDTYGAVLSAEELSLSVTNFKDAGRANHSLAPFGYGDGGGGPTREMLRQAERVANLDGMPRVEIDTPDHFFEVAKNDYPDAPVWTGELYLEKHRGTFTTQADTKVGNRRNEALLHEAELWAATAAVRAGFPYPAAELERIWRDVLLLQFHDILPGSSIAWVHQEAARMHAETTRDLERIIEDALRALGAGADTPVVAQASPVGRGALAISPVEAPAPDAAPVTITADGDDTVLDNGILVVRVDSRGLVTSLVTRLDGQERESVPPGQVANLLQVHPDVPNAWDNWDIDTFYRHRHTDLTDGDVTVTGDSDAATVTVTRRFKQSSFTQTLTLARGAAAVQVGVQADWHEHHQLVKLAWPVDVHTDEAAYEIQFGHLRRPTHENTSWDAARFEVNAQRWVHVGEPGYGLAIANARTYGWDVSRHPREGGATYSVVRASLVRGPRFPDPEADQGSHQFRFLVQPGADIRAAVDLGYACALPERQLTGRPVEPLVTCSDGAIVETVKLAEDGSGDVVLRLYEPLGVRTSASLSVRFEAAGVERTDLLEESLSDDAAPLELRDGSVELALRPFEIVTLRIRRA